MWIKITFFRFRYRHSILELMKVDAKRYSAVQHGYRTEKKKNYCYQNGRKK